MNLKEARERAGLTQEQAAERIGVNVTTVGRWERGECLPRAYQITEICAVYGLHPTDLRLSRMRLLLPHADDDPVGQLAVLPFLPPQSFGLLAHKVRYLSEKAMNIPERRKFLSGTLASLILLATSGAHANYDDLLNRCSIGLASAQEMSRSADATDLRLAYDELHAYGVLLKTIAQNSSRSRAQALELLAQCAILKVILGWHTVGDAATLPLAEEALALSKQAYEVSGNPALPLSAYSKYAWARSYKDEDHKALLVALEAKEFLLKQDLTRVPISIQGGTWSTLGLMQAKNELPPDESLGKATEADPGDEVIAFFEYTRDDVDLESGLIQYHAGNQRQALHAFEKIVDPHTLTLKPAYFSRSERGRLSTVHAMAQASLELPGRDREQIKTYCLAIADGAQTLQSEWLLNKSRGLYRDMKKAFPGEQSILEIRDHLVHWSA